MYPFIDIYILKIPVYGLLTALGYGAAIWYCLKLRAKAGLTKEQVLDIIFYLILGAVLGGKLFYIIFYWRDFAAAQWLDKIRYGFVFLGGFAGALAAGVCLLRKMKLSLLKTADFFIPAVPLGHAIGKIGCFMAGCCYGKEAHNHFFAVKFTNPQSLVPHHLHGVGLYPAQLIEALASFLLFLILYALYARRHKAGAITAAYMAGFGLLRFAAEFLRGEEEVYILGITQNQIAALAVSLAGLLLFLFLRRAKKYEQAG
jgi:phosphatidylglycerol:prolipoprotein diacylglycerol transferase